MKCGGFSDTEVNDDHLQIVNSKRAEIEDILIKKGRNGKIEHFEVLELKQQVVAGMNYLFRIKLQKDGDESILVRIYKSLTGEITIHSIEL